MYREEINISEGRYRWTEKDKQALLQKYGLQFLFDSYDDDYDRSLPLLCKKASESYKISQIEHLRDTTPIEMYKIQLEELLENSQCSYFVLLVVMAFQNHFYTRDTLIHYTEINEMSALFGITLSHLFYDNIDGILRELEGFFLVERDGVYSFVSHILYDIITFNAGRIAPDFVVMKCSSEFFRKRITFEASQKKFVPLSLSLKEDMFDCWFKRMVFEINSGYFLDLVLSETFQGNEAWIINKMNTLLPDEIRKLVLSDSFDEIEASDALLYNIRHIVKDFSGRLTPIHIFLMLGSTNMFQNVWRRVKTNIQRDEAYIIDLLKASLIGGSTICLEKLSKLKTREKVRFTSLFRRKESLLSKCDPLCISCACDNLEMTKHLIHLGYNINDCNNDGDSPLGLAVYFHNSKTTEFLLEKDIDINSKNKRGLTPLKMAIENDAILEKLLNKDVDLFMTTNDGNSVLMIACALGKRYAVGLLLNKISTTIMKERFVNHRNENGATALLMSCEWKKEVSDGIVSTLLMNGAEPNITENTLGSSPLHIAAACGSLSLVELLLNNDAHVNCVDKDGVSPLFIAADRGFCNVLELLLHHNADITAKRYFDNASALLISSEYGHYEIVSNILRVDRTLINDTNCEGSTSLLLATLNKHIKICEILIEYGADANISNQNGYAPLTVAARKCNVKLMDLFLRNGSDLNSRTREGYSSLHLACMMGHLKSVEYLIENGANTEAKDIKGHTPLDYASVLKHHAICNTLKTSFKQNSPSMTLSSVWSSYSSSSDTDDTYMHIPSEVLYRRNTDRKPIYKFHDFFQTKTPLMNQGNFDFDYPQRVSIAGSSVRSKVYSEKGSLRKLFIPKRN